MSLKILATADLHLGRRSSVVPDAKIASTKYTWNNLVEWAVGNQVDLLLLSGDVLDQDNSYFEAIGHLQAGFEKLKHAGVEVFMVAGNHDYDVLPQVALSEQFENVHLIGRNGNWELETFSKNGKQLQLVGWSFPSRYYKDDPLLEFRLEEIDPKIPCIGLLHGDVGSAEAKYAPINEQSFLNKPVDFWILGHIHKPWKIRSSEPYISYPGSPQAMSPKEQGVHGPLLLELESYKTLKVTHLPFSPVRYEILKIDISDCEDQEKFRNKITGTLLRTSQGKVSELERVQHLIYDLWLVGENANIQKIQLWADRVGEYEHQLETGTQIIVRKYVLEVRPKVDNMEELAKLSSPVGLLARNILALKSRESTPFLEQLIQKWSLRKENLDNAPVYLPLRMEKPSAIEDSIEVRELILKESYRLLGDLLVQQRQKG